MVREATRGADPVLLLQLILFAASVPLLMRLSPLRLARLLAWRERRAPAASTETIETIVRHLRLARRIGSPLVQTGCLTRGVTLYYFLRRAGVDVTLCFGLGKREGRFSGHCWLARAGLPFLEEADPQSRYVPVFSLPVDPPQPLPAPRVPDRPGS